MCVDDLSSNINVDFPWNTRDLSLCVFGQQLQAQPTSANRHIHDQQLAQTKKQKGLFETFI